jgi:hypothetical protein
MTTEPASDDNAHMLYIGGSKTSFRCNNTDGHRPGYKCGCNVFKKIGDMQYKCNGCDATYTGEAE